MGATNFVEEIKTTKSVREAFNMLVSEYEKEYGDRSYNGTISTCGLGSCKLSFKTYSESNYKKAMKYIKDNDYGDKWQADYIDLGVIGHQVITVKKVTQKNKPEFKLRYIVCSENEWYEPIHTKYYYAAKTIADKKAMELTLDTGVEHSVIKDYVLINNSKNEVTRCEISSKTYKSKPSLKDMPGRKILPIKKYIFFGWASC